MILLVRSEHDDATMSRLRTELMRSDWTILEVRLDERLTPAPLDEIASGQNASAAVRVDASQKTVEIWVSRPSGNVSETVGAEGERGGDRVLALRAFEALRARGLELTPLPAERAPRPATPRAGVRPPVPERERAKEPAPAASSRVPSLWLGGGASLFLSPGGLDPLVATLIEARLDFGKAWSIAGFGLAPVSRQVVSGEEGSAEVRTWLAGSAVEVEWARPSVLLFRSGAGAGAGLTTMAGRGASGYQGTDDRVLSFTPFVRSSLDVRLGQAVRLRSALLLGTSLPRVRVAFGPREAASWGAPFLAAAMAVDLRLFAWNDPGETRGP